ncbi:MAG: small multi-drug export protein [Armatimonadetes bacterium]|nr:small multi-drug export protein [Armatimonadota bacterium]
MTEKLFEALHGLPADLIVAVLSAAPISELRGGIPVGLLALKLPLWRVWLVAVMANIIAVAPLAAGLDWLTHVLADKPVVGKIFRWSVRRAERKKDLVDRYGFPALVFFCAVPLPGTGAWTSAMIGPLVGMRFRTTMAAVALGVIIASGIVTALTLAGVFAVQGTS